MHQKRTMGPCAQCGTPFLRRTRAGKPKQFCSWACLQSSRTPEGRFWSKVDQDGPVPEASPELGSCWLWTGSLFTDSGYGQFWLDDTNQRAHIVSYEWAIGATDGQQVQHLCNVRRCVRPAHLTLGTPAENMQYASVTGRMASGERHHKARLTDDAVRMIRCLHAEGIPMESIGKRFDVTKQTVWGIVHRKTWVHIE